jgi:hypothetical protein
MKRSDMLLWFLIILYVGLAIWAFSTGKLDAITNLFIKGFWNPIEGMVRSIFHR